MLASAFPAPVPQPPSAGVVVITDVDGLLRHAGTPTLAEARPALDALTLGGSPIVLCSARGAAEIRQMQRQLGIRHPFIADGGASLHIPQGYFCGAVAPGSPDKFETIDFGVRRLGHAVRLVIALFRTCATQPVVVGVGFDWRDRVLLREVDVPIVVRDAAVDQTALLRNVPHAYLTNAFGNDGWSEAILGHCPVGRA